jgi:hypothetical protein
MKNHSGRGGIPTESPRLDPMAYRQMRRPTAAMVLWENRKSERGYRHGGGGRAGGPLTTGAALGMVWCGTGTAGVGRCNGTTVMTVNQA